MIPLYVIKHAIICGLIHAFVTHVYNTSYELLTHGFNDIEFHMHKAMVLEEENRINSLLTVQSTVIVAIVHGGTM